jgi:hypothetical protein
LSDLGWTGAVEELNHAAALQNQSLADPVLITADGTVLAGTGTWQLAVFQDIAAISCVEYAFNEYQALEFILNYYRPRCGWNAFSRICLAMKLEPYLQQKALSNMQLGGKLKGLANLPEAKSIDVRDAIARSAGVGSRNVSNVKAILKLGHPTLIEALRHGTLTINRAVHLCKLPRTEQFKQFIDYSETRESDKVIRQAILRLQEENNGVDVATVLTALQHHEAQHPGSIIVRRARNKRTVVFVSKDLLTSNILSGAVEST